jgi:hypothetical protein
VNTPVRSDAVGLETCVILEQVVERPIGVGDMVDTNQPMLIGILRIWLNNTQVDKCATMMFVVVGEECHYRVLMLNRGTEHFPVPGEHLRKSAGPIDDMREARGSIFRHGTLLRFEMKMEKRNVRDLALPPNGHHQPRVACMQWLGGTTVVCSSESSGQKSLSFNPPSDRVTSVESDAEGRTAHENRCAHYSRAW